MIISEVATLFFYVISIAFLPEYFGASLAASATSSYRFQEVLMPMS